MCCVFYMDTSTLKNIEDIAQDVDRRIHSLQFTGDIHPMDMVPVLVKRQAEYEEMTLF